ncbi:MAG: hypothetical protein AAF919_01205 [Pseudomonadota bacterium]
MKLGADEISHTNYEITFGSETVKFSQINNLTVNYDTVDDDGLGGTVVLHQREPNGSGFYSATPVRRTKWFDFGEDDESKDKVRAILEIVRKFDIPVKQETFSADFFKRAYLNVRDASGRSKNSRKKLTT